MILVDEQQVPLVQLVRAPHLEPAAAGQGAQNPVGAEGGLGGGEQHAPETVGFRRVVEAVVGMGIDDQCCPIANGE